MHVTSKPAKCVGVLGTQPYNPPATISHRHSQSSEPSLLIKMNFGHFIFLAIFGVFLEATPTQELLSSLFSRIPHYHCWEDQDYYSSSVHVMYGWYWLLIHLTF